jgi:hypothetical protein
MDPVRMDKWLVKFKCPLNARGLGKLRCCLDRRRHP